MFDFSDATAHQVFQVTAYLLKIGIDLFQLIEKGYALDASTIKQNIHG